MGQRLLYCLIYLLPFLISNTSSAQAKSDTLFLHDGTFILINANHSTFKNSLKYEAFSLSKNPPRLTIAKNQVQRLGLNSALFNTLHTIKVKDNSTKIYLPNHSYVKGRLLAATDSSFLILHRNAVLWEANIQDIESLHFKNKRSKTLSILVGGVLGFYTGQIISSRDNPRRILGGPYNLGAVTLGTLTGIGLGAIIGNIGFKFQIDGQKDQFNKSLKKLPF